ncbi:MAG: DUF692 domain-containing protein [Corynebacteriales bacterium]|nr:DUF692 domain-containing protein [Mycobacteriales bacterium]
MSVAEALALAAGIAEVPRVAAVGVVAVAAAAAVVVVAAVEAVVANLPELGVGIGWRPDIAGFVAELSGLRFCELIAEQVHSMDDSLFHHVRALIDRGVSVIPHGVTLSLGSAEPVLAERISHLIDAAQRCRSPLVSEHIAFVRAGGLEAGHLLPIPRTKEALKAIVANIHLAQQSLPVPLALEPIAALFDWPEDEFAEPDFVTEILERTDCLLLLDVANVYANARNRGQDPELVLSRFPLERIAYVHVAGGSEVDGLYHDTHTDAVPSDVLDLVRLVVEQARPAGFLLERDGNYPDSMVLRAELDAIAGAASMPLVTG